MRCSAGWQAGRHLIKVGTRRSKLTLHAAACCLACWPGLVMGKRGSLGGMELILRYVHGLGRSILIDGDGLTG